MLWAQQEARGAMGAIEKQKEEQTREVTRMKEHARDIAMMKVKHAREMARVKRKHHRGGTV